MNTKQKKSRKRLYMLNLTTFLLGFQLSLALYVLSNFIQKRTGIENIGIFFLLAYGFSFYILIQLHHLVRKHGKSKMLMLFMGLKVVALMLMGIYDQSIIAVLFAIWSLIGGTLMWAGLDMMIENFSDDRVTGKIRGMHLTFMDTGFLFGPFLAAWTVDNIGFGPVFMLAALITSIALFIVYKNFHKMKRRSKKRDLSVQLVIQKMLRRKDIMRVYYASLMLELFYCVMTIYTPLYLLSIGLSWTEIGKIITVMLIPFVILQIPLGIMADKKTGEKEWLVVGFLIISVSTAAMSLFSAPVVYLWMFLLFLTRIGASIIQVMRDAYFYKKIGPQDIDLIDYFRTTKSIAYIMGTMFFSLFLVVLPLKMVFLMLAVLMFTALSPVLRLHDTK